MAAVKTSFKEEQKFTQWWLWVLLILVFCSPFIVQYQSIVENGFWGTFSKGIFGHIITIGLVILLFASMKLKTSIDSKGIQLHYFPFVKRSFAGEDIEELEVISYNFWQVGGWGIRLWTSFGTVYNVRGFHGLRIELKNGKKYLIGTQKPDAIKKIITTYKTQKSQE